jgi:hypothetical protein
MRDLFHPAGISRRVLAHGANQVLDVHLNLFCRFAGCATNNGTPSIAETANVFSLCTIRADSPRLPGMFDEKS